MAQFTPEQALALRMSSLLLRARSDGTDQPADVAGVVTWLGAMQAQDLASGLWSFGVRVPAYTVGDVNAALERREAAAREERRGLGVDDALAEMPYLTEQMLVTLGKAGIKTLDDLADLATDELIAKKRPEPRRRADSPPHPRSEENRGGVLGEYGLSEEQGNEIIMAARAHWFEDEGEDAVAETPQ